MENLKALIEKYPWLAHIPLLRVNEILVQNILSSRSYLTPDRLESCIVTLCIASADSSQGCLNLLQHISSESPVWDKLAEAIEAEKPLSNQVILLLYKHRSSLLMSHILEFFDILSDQAINHLNMLHTNSEDVNEKTVYSDLLGHKCGIENNPFINKWKGKYRFLPVVISLNKEFIQQFLVISTIFLEKCSFSVTSIKVVNIFYSLFKDNVIHKLPIVFDVDIFYLIDTLSEPPCVNCNKLLSRQNELEFVAEDIEMFITSYKGETRLIRTVLCMHCEWLVYMKKYSAIRCLFLECSDAFC